MSMPLRRGREGSTDGLLSPKRRRLECEPSSSAGTGIEHSVVGLTERARAQGVCQGQHHQSACEAVHGAPRTAACASARTCNFSLAESCDARQTFVDVTIEPGPTLNVVLGPNGDLPPSHLLPVLLYLVIGSHRCWTEQACAVWSGRPRSGHAHMAQTCRHRQELARVRAVPGPRRQHQGAPRACPPALGPRQARTARRSKQHLPLALNSTVLGSTRGRTVRHRVRGSGGENETRAARSCWGARRTPRSSSATARPRARQRSR